MTNRAECWGIQGSCRLFLTGVAFRKSFGNASPALFWLNLDSRSEVDDLFKEWNAAQARMIAEPQDKPWNLREFVVADPDGNLMRVFYDFGIAEADSAGTVAFSEGATASL